MLLHQKQTGYVATSVKAVAVFQLPLTLCRLFAATVKRETLSLPLNRSNFPYIWKLNTENSQKFSLQSVAPRSSHITLGMGWEEKKGVQGQIRRNCCPKNCRASPPFPDGGQDVRDDRSHCGRS